MSDSKPSPASPPSADDPPPPAPDRLAAAATLVRWSVILTALGGLTVTLGPSLRDLAYPDVRAQWAAAMSRDVPTLWPAGAVERLPTRDPAIRSEFSWGLRKLAPPLAERR